MTTEVPTILVMGASGRMGSALIRASENTSPNAKIHAFVRNSNKLSEDLSARCVSVIEGDATNVDDVKNALELSRAEVVILVVGKGIEPTDVRERVGDAVMQAINKEGPYAYVRVVAVSSLGAADTKIQVGIGLGTAVSVFLRFALKDHSNQEALMWDALGEDYAQRKRLMVIHATKLKQGNPTGNVIMFGKEKQPSRSIKRADLANWILDEIISHGDSFGTAVNISGGK